MVMHSTTLNKPKCPAGPEFKAEFHPKVELTLNPLLAPLHATFGMSFFWGGGEWGASGGVGLPVPLPSSAEGLLRRIV